MARSRLLRPMGQAEPETLSGIERALGLVLGIEAGACHSTTTGRSPIGPNPAPA